jgi:uncharacterized phage protein (TIGR01671 family)
MREIKFRAWHKEAKQMFYSKELTISYTKFDVQDGSYFTPWMFNLDGLKPNKVIEYHDDGDVSESLLDVMQYTGLKDKHGKEIYEGDIVQLGGLGSMVVVEWFSDDENVGFNLSTDFEYEVIGNIYENPE